MNFYNFKVGDRVKYTSGRYILKHSNPMWGSKEYPCVGGTVTIVSKETPNRLNIHVYWDNGYRNSYFNSDLSELNECKLDEVPIVSLMEIMHVKS